MYTQECGGVRQELQQLRQDNTSLDAGTHEREKTITQLRTRVAVLEQELQDKEQVLLHSVNQLSKSNRQQTAKVLWKLLAFVLDNLT